MRVGLFLQTVDIATRRTLPPSEIAERAARAEAAGFESVWLADHFFTQTAAGDRVHGHDPMVTLSAVAARTRRVRLGPLVLCAPFRPAAQVAREAMTLQEMSDGRFVCGVGAGWFQPEFDAAGIPFDRLVTRFEGWAEDLRRCLGDGVAVPGPEPPVWVAAGGPRMLGITARLADGWNAAWGTDDVSWFEDLVGKLRGAVAAEGREAPIELSAGVLVLPLTGDEAERALEHGRRHARFPRDAHAMTGTPEQLASVLLRYESVGADTVILSLGTSPSVDFGADLIERMAPVLELVA